MVRAGARCCDRCRLSREVSTPLVRAGAPGELPEVKRLAPEQVPRLGVPGVTLQLR
jgi:hypothetical protein